MNNRYNLVYALDQNVTGPGSFGTGLVKDEGKVRFVITGAGPSNVIHIRGRINNQETWDVLAEFTGNVNELVEVFTYDILEVLCVVFEASNGYDFKIVASSFDSNKLTIDTPNGTLDNFNTLTFDSSDDTIEITADPLTGTIDFTTGAGAGVSSVNGRTGDVILDKADVNLDQVDNTSDINKPISTATQTALDLITDVNWTGDYNNGTTYTVGDGVMFNGASFRMIAAIGAAGYDPATYPANWLQVTDYVSANDVGLGNVDNTSDADKPISDLTQDALDEKVAKAGDIMSGTLTVSVPAVGITSLGWQGITSQSADTNYNSFYTIDGAGVQVLDPGVSNSETTIYPDYVTLANNDIVAGTATSIVMQSGQISLQENTGIATVPMTPTLPEHVTTKEYVDTQDALKVSRSDTDNATEIWVSPSGNDSQLNVGSQFYPYATIQQAFNNIPDATSIQQWANERIVIHLKTGEYNESPILFYKRRSVTVVGHGAKLLQDITLNYDPKNQYPGFTYTQASLPAPWTNGFASPTLSLCCENDANGMESGFTTDAMMFLGAIKFIIANYATQATPNYGTSYVTMNGVEARGGFQVLDSGASSNGSVTLEVMTSVINGANIGLTRAGGAGSSFTLKATDSRITSDIGPRIIINKLESCRLGKLDRTYGGYTEGAIQFTNTTATTGITNCTFVGTGTQYIGNTTGTANSTIKLDLATWYQLRALTLDYGTGCLFNIMDSSKLVRIVAAEAGSTTMTNVTDHLFLDPVSTRTAYTVTMKPNPVDGDEVQISSGAFGVTTLTLLGNTGQTINGAITGLPANSWAKYRWNLATTRWIFSGSYLSSIQADINSKIPLAEKGAPNGVAPLNSMSKIDATYLPSYVDDVLEFVNLAAFPVTGSTGIIYVALDTNLIYRWSGSAYIEISPSTAPTWGSITGLLSNQTDLQNALDGKANTSHTQALSTLTQSGAITGEVPVWNGTAWIPGVPAGTAVWGGITGALSSQTDLKNILDAKFDDPTGTASQYIRGDGVLANFPSSSGGGGASVSYYLNGGTASDVSTYYQMSKTPVVGLNADFTANTGTTVLIAQFMTDVGDPSFLNIPPGNWNFEMFFNASSAGGSPTFYVELYKYNGTSTLIASGSASPESITNGTDIDLYVTALAVPDTSLLVTDRLEVRVYVTRDGKDITLHTQDSHLCQVITTFGTGLAALNGLTKQVQYLAVGTTGNDFNIDSSIDTHTFNLPTASSSSRGALSSTDWSTFNSKASALSTDISPSSFLLNNNETSPSNVSGLVFPDITVRGFKAIASVSIRATTNLYEMFELVGINKDGVFDMSITSDGDNSGVVFSITSTGQVQYTSANYSGFVDGTIKFRAITTSI